MSQLNFSYSSFLPYHPDHLCFGWDANKRFLSERRFNHALLKGQNALLTLANRYISSYTQSSEPTLLHYRDRLLGRALMLSLYNAQFTDFNYNNFTSHTKRFWSLVPYEQVWDGVPLNPSKSYNYRYAGSLGSLAFRFVDLQLEGLYPLECLDQLLSYFWSLLGKPKADAPPAERHQYILSRVALPSLAEVSSAALHLLSTSPDVVGNPHRQNLRRWLVGPNDARNLPARILLGEFNDKLLETMYEYMDLDPRQLVHSQHVLTSILPPAGMPQLYLLFALESLYLTTSYITQLDKSLQTAPLDYVLRGQNDSHRQLAKQLAEYLVLASDAFYILSLFNTFNDAKQNHRYFLSETLYWMKAAGLSIIPEEHSHRLSDFLSNLDGDT